MRDRRHSAIIVPTRSWRKRWGLLCIDDGCDWEVGPFKTYGDVLLAQHAVRSSEPFARTMVSMTLDPRILTAVGRAYLHRHVSRSEVVRVD